MDKYINGQRNDCVFISDTDEIERQVCQYNKKVVTVAHGAHIVWDKDTPVTIFAAGDARIDLELAGNSRPCIVCVDFSRVALKTKGDAAPKIKTKNYSSIEAKTYGTSVPIFEGKDQSKVFILARENSRPYLNATDFCLPFVTVQDSAKPSCADWPHNWEAIPSDIYIGQRLKYYETWNEAVSATKSLYSEWQLCHNRYVACMRTVGAIPKICPNVVHFRSKEGTIHVELPGEDNIRPWYTGIRGGFHQLTEIKRNLCIRYYLDE